MMSFEINCVQFTVFHSIVYRQTRLSSYLRVDNYHICLLSEYKFRNVRYRTTNKICSAFNKQPFRMRMNTTPNGLATTVTRSICRRKS